MITSARIRSAAAPVALATNEVAARTIPFDHTFRIGLRGEPQRVHRTTVTVSVEASFTAVSIGYGVVPEVTPIIFGPVVPRATFNSLQLIDLITEAERSVAISPDVPKDVPILEAILRNGIKLNPVFARAALLDRNALLNPNVVQRLFQIVSAPSREVQFLYALFDEGSGREFQSDPLLNIAGLGSSDGKRPFRYFAQPITFASRATIRLDVTEVSDFRGELHVSLHGYKVLGGAGTPTGARQQAPRQSSRSR
jgi:hypothetical protein